MKPKILIILFINLFNSLSITAEDNFLSYYKELFKMDKYHFTLKYSVQDDQGHDTSIVMDYLKNKSESNSSTNNIVNYSSNNINISIDKLHRRVYLDIIQKKARKELNKFLVDEKGIMREIDQKCSHLKLDSVVEESGNNRLILLSDSTNNLSLQLLIDGVSHKINRVIYNWSQNTRSGKTIKYSAILEVNKFDKKYFNQILNPRMILNEKNGEYYLTKAYKDYQLIKRNINL